MPSCNTIKKSAHSIILQDNRNSANFLLSLGSSTLDRLQLCTVSQPMCALPTQLFTAISAAWPSLQMQILSPFRRLLTMNCPAFIIVKTSAWKNSITVHPGSLSGWNKTLKYFVFRCQLKLWCHCITGHIDSLPSVLGPPAFTGHSQSHHFLICIESIPYIEPYLVLAASPFETK